MMQPSVDVRIAVCQIPNERDLKASADRVVAWLKKASARRADVAVFPEVALGGYSRKRRHYDQLGCEACRAAERRVIRACGRLGIAAVVGTVRWSEPGLHNSLLIVDRGGQALGYQDKIHPAEPWSTPGETLAVYTLCGVASCFLVCFDWRFPELVRLSAAAGAKICYCSAFHNDPSYEHKMSAYQALPVARAAENGIFFVSVTPPASASNLRFGSHGRSKIVDPDGNVLAEGSVFGEELVVADIDPKRATGLVARRAVEDDTFLKGWLAPGGNMVEGHRPPRRQRKAR